MNLKKPKRLRPGDTIGIAAPCYAIQPEKVELAVRALEEKGFRVLLSKHIFSTTHGYAGSVEERAEDFNAMIADGNVKMLLFGGGEVGNEILPHIDYEAVRANPKILLSYSDGTTILNAIHTKTGLVTFYGASPRTFFELAGYNWSAFQARLMAGSLRHEKGSEWKSLHGGRCEGTLTGGYLLNYAFMQGGRYFRLDAGRKYILFIEDYTDFNDPAAISKLFTHLEQSGLMDAVSGLIFGHYSNEEEPLIGDILARIGKMHSIPVVWNDDFGHGINNAVLPIGVSARLDADNLDFEFLESGVE